MRQKSVAQHTRKVYFYAVRNELLTVEVNVQALVRPRIVKAACSLVFICAASAAQAQLAVTQTLIDNAPSTSFTNGLHWSDGLPPHGDADYYVISNALVFRTPEGAGNYVFAGRTLTLSNSFINVKGTGTVTVNDMRLYAGRIANGIGASTLAGTNTVFAAPSAPCRYSGSSSRVTSLTGVFLGSGDLSFDRTETESGAFYCELRGDNSAFTGGMRVVGPDIELRAVHTNGLGGILGSFRADALKLCTSGALYVASSMTLQGNRGVTLATGGVFRVTGANVLTLAGPIAGTGGVVIKGDGRVDLNYAMTYSGDMTVEGGTLRILSGFALPDAGRIVMKSGTRTLEGDGFAGNVRMEGGAINPGTGTSVGLLTVSNLVMSGGALRFDFASGATADFVRVTGVLSNALATPIPLAIVAPLTNECPALRRLLTAPNLGDLTVASFALQRDFGGLPEGTLDLLDESGVKTLVFRQSRPVICLTTNDTQGASSFTSGTRWSDGAVPSADKDYLVASNLLMRSVEGALVASTFPGKSLTIAESGDLRIKGLSASVSDIRLYGGRITQGTPPTTQYLYGNLSVFSTAASPFNFEIEGASPTERRLVIGGTLLGTGDIRFRSLIGSTQSSGGTFALTATNTSFTGGIAVNGSKSIELGITDERNLGGNPATFRADLLKLTSNGVLFASSSLVIDDANRGVTLDTVGGILRVETNTTLTVAVPITGVGKLTQRGSGVVVLSGTNSYRGGSAVESNGTLEVRSPWALGSNSVTFASNTLLRIPRDDSTLPLGVRLGGATPLTVAGTLRVTPLFGEGKLPQAFDLPLFLLMQATNLNPSLLTPANTPSGYSATVETRIVNDAGTARTQVYVRYRWAGLVLLVQ